MHILFNKRSNSDIHKTWNRIFIEYTNTTKHLRVWAPKIYQVLIIRELVVSNLKLDVDFLIENLMPSMLKLLQLLIGELKPKEKPRKKSCRENKVEQNDSINNDVSLIKTKTLHNWLLQKPRTELGGTSDKNLLIKGLVRLVQEFARLVTEYCSKAQESKSYDEVINDLIYGNRGWEAIDEEL